jgi:hypothetical protein
MELPCRYLNTALVGDTLGIFHNKDLYNEYPGGIACMVWKGLKKRYINLTLDFNKELNAISMTRDADPNTMIDQLETLSARYTMLRLDVPDDAFVARALVLAPTEYASTLTAEKRMKKLYDETLTLEDMRASMDTIFTTNYSETAKVTVNSENTNKEVQRFNFNGGRDGR